MKVYGIDNCDSCRKAKRWLDESGVSYRWADLRRDPPDDDTLARWIDQVGTGRLVNRRSKTWRDLSDAERAGADSPGGALALLRDHPTLIKRPVIDAGEVVLVGFTNDTERTLLELP